ncbi:serine protease inhibitor 42Dd-like [Haematobia irritans]|uniref:serine protease inhibitor 42Dd-like n=1 Tax=Haematobia irritans TaxID=7368 RepID=UPI003F4FEE89
MADLEENFVNGGLQFTMEILEKLKLSDSKVNTIISPFSLQTCIALALAGAEGETAKEIAVSMKYGSTASAEIAKNFHCILDQYKDSKLLQMANKIYVKEGKNIKDDYKQMIQSDYYAGAESIDFTDNEAAAGLINSWVEDKTLGKIVDLIPSQVLGEDTLVLLLNALHFKGQWQNKFDEAYTKEGDFSIDSEQTVKVQYMRQTTHLNHAYIHEHKFSILEMPYNDSDLSMLILLPDAVDGLKDLMTKLKEVSLMELSQRMTNDEVILMLPKFRIDYSIDAKEILQEMGITKAFSNEADFSGMLDPSENMFISNIFHKASIEVNEEGTEAAAATGAVMMARCLMGFEFIADHPFIYYIWNKKNILFAGAFVNASKDL